MKKLIFILFSVLSLVSCSKKSDSSSSSYTNKLELGTGLNPTNLFQLTGTGTSFAVNSAIFFRLESSDDMAGSEVRIKIETSEGVVVTSTDFPNPQSYGHIFLSSFVMTGTGSYKATGILVATNKTVASVNFSVF